MENADLVTDCLAMKTTTTTLVTNTDDDDTVVAKDNRNATDANGLDRERHLEIKTGANWFVCAHHHHRKQASKHTIMTRTAER